MFGCGTLVVCDASTPARCALHDIPHVEQVQHRLTELLGGRTAARPATGPDDGT